MSYDGWKSNQDDYSEPTTPQADEAGDEEDRKQQAGLVFPYKGHRVEMVLSPGVGCYGHILIDGVIRLRETNLFCPQIVEKRATKLIDEDTQYEKRFSENVIHMLDVEKGTSVKRNHWYRNLTTQSLFEKENIK